MAAERPTLSSLTSAIERNLVAQGVGQETAARLAQQRAPEALQRAQDLHDYRATQAAEQQRLIQQGTDPAEAAARSHSAAAEKFGDLDMSNRAQAVESARVANLDPERFRQMDLMVPESIKNDPVKWDSFERARLAEEARLHREMPQLSPEWQTATAHADALHLHGVKVPMLDGAGEHPRAAALADDALAQESARIQQHLLNNTGVSEETAERIARQQAPESLARAQERAEHQAAQADEAARATRTSEAAAAAEAARPDRPIPISPDEKFQQLGQHQTVPRPEPGANVASAADDAGRAAAAAADSPLRTVGDARTSPPPQVTQDGPLRSVGDPRPTAGQPEGARSATAETGAAPDPARRIDTNGTFDESRTSPITTRESAAQAAADSAAADATRTHTFPDGTTATGMPDEHGKMQWFDNDTGDPLRSGANGEPVRPAAAEAPAAANASTAADDTARAASAGAGDTGRPAPGSADAASRPANTAEPAAKPAAPASEAAPRPSAPAAENPRASAPVGDAAPRPTAPSAPAAPTGAAPSTPASGQPAEPARTAAPTAQPAGAADPTAGGRPPADTTSAGSGGTHLSSGDGGALGGRVPDAPTAPATPSSGQTPAAAADTPAASSNPAATQTAGAADSPAAAHTNPTATSADAPQAPTNTPEAPVSNPTTQPAAPETGAGSGANTGAGSQTPATGDAPASTQGAQAAPQGNPAPDAPATSTSSSPGGAAQPDAAAHTGSPAPAANSGTPTGASQSGTHALGTPDASSPGRPAGSGPAMPGSPNASTTGSAGSASGAGDAKTSGSGAASGSGADTAGGSDKSAWNRYKDAAGDASKKTYGQNFGDALRGAGTGAKDIATGQPVKGIKGLLASNAKAGAGIGEKLGTKAGAKLAEEGLQGLGKGALKTAGRFLPGVGMVVGGYLAYQSWKEGDYVGMVLNGLGMIPGPVGWISMGLAVGWDFIKPHKTYDMWAAPDGTNTFILQGEAKDVSGVKDSDAQLRKAQASVLSFQDGPTGTVWSENPPAALSLSTQEVVAAATEWLTGISDHFAAIDKAMTDSGEQYISEQRQALVPHFTAMAKLKTQVKDLTDQLTTSSTEAAGAYQAVLDTNKDARSQLSTDGTLNDQGPAKIMLTKLQNAQAAITAADDKLTKLFAETPPAVVAVRTDTGSGTRPTTPTPEKPVTATPAAVTPAAQTPAAQTPAKTETPTKNNDDLSKLLSQLGNKAQTPTTGSPLGSGSGLGGGSPLGTGTGGGSGGGGTPLSSSKPDTSEKKDEGKKLGDDKKLGERKTEEPRKLDDKSLSGAKPEQAKAAVPAEQKPQAAAPAVAAPGAAAPAGTPAKPGAPAAQPEPSKEVDVKGQKTTFPDAKTAKLASLLSQADPTHPMSLADAAAQAGLTPPVPGQDPGKQVSPADAKPGDIMVAGDKSYMLLGDGKFYDLTEYKIVGASELPQNMGDRAGYFHLNDPTAGQAGAGAPVSGQTSGVPFNVPNATGAPTGPIDGSPNPAGAGAPGTGAPGAGAGGTQPPAGGGTGGAQPPAGGSPSGGVPSVGAPGVPKPAAPGAGPANAASTNTGTGSSVPSSTPGALDPSAVRD